MIYEQTLFGPMMTSCTMYSLYLYIQIYTRCIALYKPSSHLEMLLCEEVARLYAQNLSSRLRILFSFAKIQPNLTKLGLVANANDDLSTSKTILWKFSHNRRSIMCFFMVIFRPFDPSKCDSIIIKSHGTCVLLQLFGRGQ